MNGTQLVMATQQGDLQAFNELVKGYQRLLVASARHFTQNADDAEDLAQDALLDAYRNLSALRDPAKFRSWLFAILRHKCLSYLQQRRSDETVADDVEEIPAPAPAEFNDIGELLDLLPYKSREMIILRYLQELSYAEIVNLLGISEEAARVRCLRARERLRALASERDESKLRQAMAGLLGVPISKDFATRVIKGVTIMESTGKTTAGAAGVTGLLAALASWKGALIVGGTLLIGGGLAAPKVNDWWQARAGKPLIAQVQVSEPDQAKPIEEMNMELPFEHKVVIDEFYQLMTAKRIDVSALMDLLDWEFASRSKKNQNRENMTAEFAKSLPKENSLATLGAYQCFRVTKAWNAEHMDFPVIKYCTTAQFENGVLYGLFYFSKKDLLVIMNVDTEEDYSLKSEDELPHISYK